MEKITEPSSRSDSAPLGAGSDISVPGAGLPQAVRDKASVTARSSARIDFIFFIMSSSF
jgi:hypothetical protein